MIKTLDPAYHLLRFVVLRRFISCELKEDETEFVNENIDKHRSALWLNVLASGGVAWGLKNTPTDMVSTLIVALLGPVAVMGTAWFAISFGGIPRKLMSIAMSVTFWMFTGFQAALSAMFLAVAFIAPWQIYPMLVLVFYAAYASCVQYDTADGLKAGLDEAVLGHSRAALLYYRKQGIDPEKGESVADE